MLKTLRGRAHTVTTGLAVINKMIGKRCTSRAAATVVMRPYSDGEIQDYITSGNYADKAGAYGVQDAAFSPAERVDGCFLNVVGFPLCELAVLLAMAGTKLPGGIASKLPAVCLSCRCRTFPTC